MMKAGVLCLAMCAAIAPTASAQMTWTDKGFVNLSGGVQAGSQTLETKSTFDLYLEQGSMDATQKVKSGGFFDVSVGYKVWHNLALGVGYSRAGSKADAAITLSVPDPVFFDRPRSVTASATGLAHTENTVNLMAVWMVPVTDKIDVGVSAGPSIFMLKQELPNSPSITEPGPIVGPIDLSSADKTTAGFNLGVDVTYMLNKRFGVGGLARYTWGSAAITGATNDLKLGGFQIGAGLRTRF